MIISFNNHYSGHDREWVGNLPIRPYVCFHAIFKFLKDLKLDKNQIHTLVMPGVRGAVVVSAYHTLLGHFPNMLFSRREGSGWVWDEIKMQELREKTRAQR